MLHDAYGGNPICHTNDPASSYEAAERMNNLGLRAEHKRKVLEAVRLHPGETSAEIERYVPYDLTETRRRLNDLKNDRLIKRGPLKTCSVRGNRQSTWEAL